MIIRPYVTCSQIRGVTDVPLIFGVLHSLNSGRCFLGDESLLYIYYHLLFTFIKQVDRSLQ